MNAWAAHAQSMVILQGGADHPTARVGAPGWGAGRPSYVVTRRVVGSTEAGDHRRRLMPPTRNGGLVIARVGAAVR
jgi:hypothetical protein